MLTAYRSGAVIAGSSAGAMVLYEYYYDPVSSRVLKGLNLVERICILPHHNMYAKDWVPQLQKQLPDSILFGIDEETVRSRMLRRKIGRFMAKARSPCITAAMSPNSWQSRRLNRDRGRRIIGPYRVLADTLLSGT